MWGEGDNNNRYINICQNTATGQYSQLLQLCVYASEFIREYLFIVSYLYTLCTVKSLPA